MIITIDSDTQIRGTAFCWQIEKKRKRKGADDWCALSYHSTFGDALGAACRREIRLAPTSTLSEAIEAANQVAAKFGRLLDEATCQ